jgi:hypothetical protein
MESKEVFKKVFKGVDSLYLSYRGLLREGVKEFLEEKKELAQSDCETDQAMSRVVICDHLFEVMGCGVRYYPIIMVDNWYRIQVSVSKAKKMPEIYVKISSEVLNCHGIDRPLVMLRKVVRKLLVKIEQEVVSRADLFVDFNTNVKLENIDNTSWVTKAKKLAVYWSGNSFTGMSIGLGGDISARLYDKTFEIGISHKDYLKEMWEKQGWDTLQKVWRLEFQLKRKYLKQMFVSTHLDLKIKANSLWSYCTKDWLRLAVKDDTVNRTRWMTNPMWKSIQGVRINDGKMASILREVEKTRAPSDEVLFKNGMGYLTSFAAKEGFDNVNGETMISFLDIGKKYLEEVTNGKEEEYLKKKINNKKKKYNKE